MASLAMQAMNSESKLANRPGDLEHAISAGYAQLARAICRQALADAIRNKSEATRQEAAAWLLDENGQALAEMTGFNTALISRWIRAGCPEKVNR